MASRVRNFRETSDTANFPAAIVYESGEGSRLGELREESDNIESKNGVEEPTGYEVGFYSEWEQIQKPH